MIITINNVDYRLVSKDAIFSVSYPDLIEKINSIIDWENSKFPENIDITSGDEEPKMVEDRNALGPDPKLRERVTFYYRDQLFFVVDKDTLGLVNSDTGALGLIRVVNDYILPEYKIRKDVSYLDPLDDEGFIKNNIAKPWYSLPIYAQFLNSCVFGEVKEELKHKEPNLRLPYFIMDFLIEEFPELKEKEMTVQVNSPEIDILDVTITILPTGKVFYDEDEVADEDHVRSEILSLLAGKMN